MANKFFVLCTLVLAFQFSGCTSNQSQDENQTVENADVDKIESEGSTANVDQPAGDVSTSNDPSLQAALGEETTAPSTPATDLAPADPAPEVAANETIANDVAAAPTLDESSLNPDPTAAATTNSDMTAANPPPMDMGTTNLTESTAPPTDTSSVAVTEPIPMTETTPTETPVIENSGTNTAMTETPSYSAPVKKAGGELKKLANTVPYKIASGWVNTVYVARPHETLKEISQKIYSSDKTKELKKISGNSFLKNRSVRAGDKIYYVSPNRPDDSTTTRLYYEDMGMVPETYVAKSGDNLKKVAKNILGYDKAYIEMWTANPVESKDKLNEGETLRYWKSASGVTTVAANTPNQGTAQLIDQGQMPTAPEMPAAPPMDPSASMPPPPTMDAAAAGTTHAAGDLPPPPDTASLPPPPPPPPPESHELAPPPVDETAAAGPKKKHMGDEEAAPESAVGGLDNDTMMSLGAVGVLTVALAIVLIRRKKKKAESAAMHSEQFGS